MRMGQGVRTGLGHGGITCVLQTQFSSYICIHITMLFIFLMFFNQKIVDVWSLLCTCDSAWNFR